MGGVEEIERPLKRLKVSSAELGSHLKNSSSSRGSDPLANPLPSKSKEEMVGSNGTIKKTEFVRIITEALYSLGYKRSGATLEEESGIPLHSSAVEHFRDNVLAGNWDESVASLYKIGIEDENVLKSASFLVLERKFFELLEKNRQQDALKTLRSEITPLSIKKERVHELSRCIAFPSQRALLGIPNLGNESTDSRLKLLEELQKCLPAAIMFPEKRLEHLVEQALSVQREACFFHNFLDNSLALYADHHCGNDLIPSKTAQVLQGHKGEVWFLLFSNNGKYLASSSNDKSAIIWEIREDGEVSMKHMLTGHQTPVVMVAWSPDDRQLLSCGVEEVVRRWDVCTGECLHVYRKDSLGLISCSWFPDGKQIFSGITDKSICVWGLDGEVAECWKGQRTMKTSDAAITKDGRRIISICRNTAILLLDRETEVEKLIEEDEPITSFSLSRDGFFLLMNLGNEEIQLWNIVDEPYLVTKYKGHKRSRFVIRSCFGGLNEAFIASGSEDSQVYIWQRKTGDLIQRLPGHSGAVSCVSWNPVNPHMLASGSDDHTIRVWGLSRGSQKRKEIHSNGVSPASGTKSN